MAKADVKITTDLDSSKMQASLTRMRGGISNMLKSATSKFIALGAVIGGLRGLGGLGKLAMEAEEVDSKFKAVFKDSAPQMAKAVDELREHIHLTTTEMKNSLATYGAMADGMGLTEEAGMVFSKAMVKLQGDLASFHNLESEEAFNKIKSAISGEFEPLKQLGIVLNEATVKQEALNLGIYDGTTALTTSQKAIAVQSAIVRLMGDAVGDAEATTDSSMNSYKRLNAELKNMAEAIGVFLVPAINLLVDTTSVVTNSVKNMNKANFVAKSSFRDEATEALIAEGVLRKFRRGTALTAKTAKELGVNFRNSTEKTRLLYEKILELEEAERKLQQTQGNTSEDQAEDAKIRADALSDQKNAIEEIIEAMGGVFEQQQSQLRASDKQIKNAKALLGLEEQRLKALDKADTNKSGVTTDRERRAEEKRQKDIERQRRTVARKERALERIGGEESAFKKEAQSRFGDASLQDPSTREGKMLKSFEEEKAKLQQMELGDMARDKGLDGTATGSDDALGDPKAGGAGDEAEKGQKDDMIQVLEEIKGFNETTDENITKVRELLDKIDGALT